MDIKLELVLQEPINFNGIIIYQPTIEDIMKFGKDKFNELLLPYSLTMDNISLNISDEEKLKLKVFDLVLTDQNLLGSFVQSLMFFCHVTIDDLKLCDDNCITVRDSVINRDNFEELGDILLEINSRERPKAEKPPEFQHEKGTKEWEEGYKKWLKIQENRRKYSKNTELKLEDVINTVQYAGRYHIPISYIKTLTLFNLINAYKVIMQLDNYNSSFRIYLVSGDKAAIEKHWSESIKL